jgi:hypothetical protein
MAAPKENLNALGNSGGKSRQDRILAARVRNKTLSEIEKVLDGEDSDYKKQLVLKLAGTVLPRLNEHTGEDGEAINVNIVSYVEPDASVQIPTKIIPITVSQGDTDGKEANGSGLA